MVSVLQETSRRIDTYATQQRTDTQSKKNAESQIVQNFLVTYPTRTEQLAAWSEQTGKSQRAFYRRLHEITERD